MNPAPRDFPSLVGQNVDGFVVLQELGRGRTSVVYQAMESAEDNRMVALKVLEQPERRHLVSQDPDLNQFDREAKVSRLVKNPGIVQMFRTGRLGDGRCWVAMEYVDGMPLAEELRHRGTIPWEEAVQVAIRIASAVGGLHKRRIVHRDLDAGNAMVRLGKSGKLRVKLIDFGLARFVYEPDGKKTSIDSSTIGNPRYMAPEQARRAGSSAQTDVYSVGVLLYEMLTGRSVTDVAEPSPAKALAYLRSKAPIPAVPVRKLAPDVPEAIVEVVSNTLSREPRRRARHGDALAKELEVALSQGAVEASAQRSPLQRMRRRLGALLSRVGKP